MSAPVKVRSGLWALTCDGWESYGGADAWLTDPADKATTLAQAAGKRAEGWKHVRAVPVEVWVELHLNGDSIRSSCYVATPKGARQRSGRTR